MISLRSAVLVLALFYYPLTGLYSRLVVLGVLRSSPLSITSSAPPLVLEQFVLTDIKQAEDFAYHSQSGLIFFTAVGNTASRYGWWPPITHLDRPEDALTTDGGIWTLDPKSRRIPIKGLSGPLIPHGLDIYSPATEPDTLYLHAINHKPADHGPHRANSTVEILRITLSTLSAELVQTVHHPLIVTPNDVYSISPTEFLVTNDHVNREHGLPRSAEELLTLSLASLTNLVHVNAATGEGKVVKKGIHSANGLGRGPNGEIILMDAAGGVLNLLDQNYKTATSLTFPNTVDNPSYLADPYATPGSDLSGYAIAGLYQAAKMAELAAIPDALVSSVVWLARQTKSGKWEKQKILEDDGGWVNAATTAMVFPIDPKTTAGRREAWVVVTGFLARGVAVARMDLSDWARV